MSVFTDSIGAWVSGLSINSVIMMIMMIFMLVGAIDKIMGNKFGYGEEFEAGFNAIGPLALSMAGVVAAAPVLALALAFSLSSWAILGISAGLLVVFLVIARVFFWHPERKFSDILNGKSSRPVQNGAALK